MYGAGRLDYTFVYCIGKVTEGAAAGWRVREGATVLLLLCYSAAVCVYGAGGEGNCIYIAGTGEFDAGSDNDGTSVM